MRLTLLAGIPLLFAAIGLQGCSASFDPLERPVSSAGTTEVLGGYVHGGRQPVAGARVFLLAAGTGGYGGAGILPSSSNQSVSLLKSVTTGAFPTALDSTVGSPTKGFYYVTSDAGGAFNLGGAYTCTSGQQVYLYAVGGQPSPGTTNSAAGFLSVLGNCPGGTLAAQVPVVTVNEVSTVAAAYALAAFASDALHISSSGTTLALTGIKNAFANAAQMYDITGAHGMVANTVTPAGNGTVPNMELNAIANSLAACVNSTGSASTQCGPNLFGAVSSTGTGGTRATDTATEAIYIAHNPTTAVATVFDDAASIGTPFLPTLSTAPANFTVGVYYTAPNDISYTNKIAIDAAGNAWLCGFHPGTVTKLSPKGVVLSGTSGYSNGLNGPLDIAIDFKGNAWVVNFYAQGAAVLSGSDGSLQATITAGGLSFPTSIAFDGSDNAWILNSKQVAKVNSMGDPAPGSPFAGGQVSNAAFLAVDASGNVWVTGSSDLYEFTNAGAPVGSGYSTGSFDPAALALDSSNQVWLSAEYYSGNTGTGGSTMYTSETVHFSATGSVLFSEQMYSNTPFGIAVDGAGQAWVANYGSGGLLEVPTGPLSQITGGIPVPSNATTTPEALSVAVDGSGDIWVGFSGPSVVTELFGLASPVVTPLGASLAAPYGNPAAKP